VSFDHSYQVCAQCHSRQASDWASGAHGKRAGGWAPPRVIYACAQCHNPHSPRWDTRWPAVAGRQE
jgi:cytochrome c553